MKPSSKISLIAIALFSITSCTYKLIRYKTYVNHKVNFYKFKIPKNYIRSEFDNERESATIFKYTDSSYITVSDDIADQAFPPDAVKKYGNDVTSQFLAHDTIIFDGYDQQFGFWRIGKLKNIVINYGAKDKKKKALFDSLFSISSIRSKSVDQKN